ncbi:MAG: tetratricopeptide repeat protein, partial [Nitrospirota bacterium]
MIDETSLQAALGQHQAGNLDEAERIYREILQRQPDNADALHLLGIVLFQKKNYDAAVPM